MDEIARYVVSRSAFIQKVSVSLLAILLLTGCSRGPEQIYLRKMITGLDFPVFLTAPADDSARLFIVEQTGRIRIYRDGKLLSRPFLDITHKVRFNHGEMGFLCLAFHPRYSSNGYFYVSYIDRYRNTIIERYSVTNNPEVANPTSAKLILELRKRSRNHHGGMLLFGPDGKLYIGVGDGSPGGDPAGNAQNKATLLGDMLRLDLDNGDPYLIPKDNPYYGHPRWRGELWAIGLRNPWRFSFDLANQLLYIGDVGEKQWEEIDIVPATSAGNNFGWRILEGNHCFPAAGPGGEGPPDASPSCATAGLTPPIQEYSHQEGCAVIGGYVYRGKELRSIQGHYFYGDYCLGWIRSFQYDGKRAVNHKLWDFGVAGNVTSFGEDSRKNLYVLYEEGNVYRFSKRDSAS